MRRRWKRSAGEWMLEADALIGERSNLPRQRCLTYASETWRSIPPLTLFDQIPGRSS
jgi:hypothetical protein